tara:strand:+ start:157 stop:519 length:363 start_codon:yes stop_codon:yes gene_type:complete
LHQLNIKINNKLFYKLLAIALGAFWGGVLRWQIKNYIIVNIIGSTLLGFLVPFKQLILIKALLGFGFCGALTTFSSWMMNSIDLAFQGLWLDAMWSIFCPLFLGLIFANLGFSLGKKLTG